MTPWQVAQCVVHLRQAASRHADIAASGTNGSVPVDAEVRAIHADLSESYLAGASVLDMAATGWRAPVTLDCREMEGVA